MRRTLPLALVLLVGPSLARPLPAQETASDSLLTVNHYLDWEQVADPQISPDGAQIVYTRRWVNKLEDKWESALWIMNVDGSHNRFLVKGSDARWSPDGTRILYLADGEPKGAQLFVRWMDAEGASSQVTRVLEKPANPRWAPCITVRTAWDTWSRDSRTSSWCRRKAARRARSRAATGTWAPGSTA